MLYSTGDLNCAAVSLEDLASLINDVGIGNLQRELGIDMNVVFDE